MIEILCVDYSCFHKLNLKLPIKSYSFWFPSSMLWRLSIQWWILNTNENLYCSDCIFTGILFAVCSASSLRVIDWKLILHTQVHHQPTPVVNFQSDESEKVILSGFTCHKENVFVLVETTAPPTQKKMKKRRLSNRNLTK